MSDSGGFITELETAPWDIKFSTYFLVSSTLFLFAGTLGFFFGKSRSPSITKSFDIVHFLGGENFTVFEIILNNLTVFVAIVITGILTYGVVSSLILLKNGFVVGTTLGALVNTVGFRDAFFAIFPHGILEFMAFLLAGTVAFRIAHITLLITTQQFEALYPDSYSEGHSPEGFHEKVLPNVLENLITISLMVIFLFIIAAFIEVYITPSLV